MHTVFLAFSVKNVNEGVAPNLLASLLANTAKLVCYYKPTRSDTCVMMTRSYT